jgi:hypothetical protein
MKWFFLCIIWWIPFVKCCKPICYNLSLELYHTTDDIMTKLENEITTNIKIIDLEMKMIILSRTIVLSKQIDEHFKILNQKHEIKIKKYESLLNSIGLSPAREDEIYLIEEMEQVAKYKTNPFNL